MKPLPVAPHTAEDWDILVNHRGDAERAYFMGWRLGINRESDRRDAEVMLQLTHYDHWERDYTRDRVRSVATAVRLVGRQL